MFFDIELEGHHLEYLHHYYMGAISSPQNLYFFVVPDTFNKYKSHFEWPEAKHINFIFIKHEDILKARKNSMLKSDYECSRLLKKYIERLKPERVFLTMLIHYLPYILMVKNDKPILSGIIYRIYLYEWANLSMGKKFINVIKFLILSNCSNIKNIYVLNDRSSAIYLNKVYKTSKFEYLIDPYIPINKKFINVRNEYGIPSSKRIYLHFGALSERKGTLTILDSIKLLTLEERKNFVFVFIGNIHLNIKAEFYKKVEELQSTINIIVKDEFVDFETLGNFCYTCDVVLLPYKSSIQSSGVIGYAAQFGKPVIGPSTGILGKLIRKFNIGYTLKDISAESLRQIYLMDFPLKKYGEKYLLNNTISNFVETIFKPLKECD